MAVKALDILPEVVDRLVREFDPDQIYLFGSHAWGQPNEHSDPDLMLIVPALRGSPHEERIRVRRCLRDIEIPKDILIETAEQMGRRAQVAASLERLIRDRGRVIYERPPESRGKRVALHQPA